MTRHDTTRRRFTCAPVVAGALLLGLLVPAGTALSDAPAVRTEPADDTVLPEDVQAGTLLWKHPDGMRELPMLETTVSLEITGNVLRGVVQQRFHNPTDQVIEALYVFPMPDGAAVNHMEMRIGPRTIRAVAQENEQAQRTYQQAKSEGRKAALVGKGSSNLFTTSAANINPGESVDVVLEYVETVGYLDGAFHLRFPLTFTPRYGGAVGAATEGSCSHFVPADRPTAPTVHLAITLRAGVPLAEVSSVSHTLDTFLDGDAWVVGPAPDGPIGDRDFLLSWQPLVDDRTESGLFVEERSGGRYGMLMLVPQDAAFGDDWGLQTETLFVIDVSGSMKGPSIVQARDALLEALDRLRPDDTFNILRFNDSTEAFSSRSEPAFETNLEHARQWVRSLQAGGGTEIHLALLEGISMLRQQPDDRVKRLIFLTDGAASHEAAVYQSIVERLGKIRLHTVGIGEAPNARLMRKMAEFGRGFCEFISAAVDTSNAIDEFFARIDRPVMTELALEFEGATPQEVYPSRIPDLYPGQPLVVSFLLDPHNSPGQVRLLGRARNGRLDESFPLAGNVKPRSGVAALWARNKVAALTDELAEGADPAMIRREVVAVGLEFNLVTRYTSLVAVEEFASALGPSRSVPVANASPAGSKLGLPDLPRGGTQTPWIALVGMVLAGVGGLLVVVTLGSGPRW